MHYIKQISVGCTRLLESSKSYRQRFIIMFRILMIRTHIELSLMDHNVHDAQVDHLQPGHVQSAHLADTQVRAETSGSGLGTPGRLVHVAAQQPHGEDTVIIHRSGPSESVGAGRSLLDLKQRTIKAKENRKEGGIVYSIRGTFMYQ